MSEAPRIPVSLLVVHEDPTAILALKRALEAVEVAEVVGASGLDGAIDRLDAQPVEAVLLHWALPGGQALRTALRIGERSQRPRLIAFQARWSRDDLGRALQLGVDALLPSPVHGDALLEALERPVGVHAAIQTHGVGLLEGADDLWLTEPSDIWRARMVRLAAAVRRRFAATHEERVHALHQRLEAAAGAALTVSIAKAVLAVVEQGDEVLPRVADTWQIEPALLARLVRRAGRFADATVGPDGLPLMLRDLLEVLRRRVERVRADGLARLQRAARATLQRVRRDEPGPLLEVLAEMLGVPRDSLLDLPAARLQRLAARLLLEEDEDAALEHAREVLLAHLVRRAAGGVHAEDVEGLAALLDLKPGVGGLQTGALLARLGVLNPEPELQDLDLSGLRPYGVALRARGEQPVLDELRATVTTLVSAAAPGGSIDTARVAELLSAIERDEATLVGRSTWASLVRALEAPDRPPADEVVERLLFALGGRGAADTAPLRTAMRDLLTVRRSALDLGRFLLVCREALARPLDLRSLRSMVGEELEGSHELAGLEDDPRLLFDQARLSDVLREFGLGPDGVREAELPACEPSVAGLAPRQLVRLKVLATLLGRERDDAGRSRLLSHHLPPRTSRADHSVALCELADSIGDTRTVALVRRRVGLDGQPVDPPAVDRLLDRGNLDGAFHAVHALPDGDPAVERLNAVGLAFHEAGRHAECESLYRRALRLRPDRINLWFNFARVQYELGHDEEALPLVREVLRRAPHFTPGRDLFTAIEARLQR